jgi:hypothetical protein
MKLSLFEGVFLDLTDLFLLKLNTLGRSKFKLSGKK